MKTIKKGVWTLQEIGARAFKAWPGRWKDEESAYASVRAAAQRLGVGDINGKKKYKLIAAVDVSRILGELTRIDKKKRHESGQADFFALLPEEPAALAIDPGVIVAGKITPEIKQQLKDALTGPAEFLTINQMPEMITQGEPIPKATTPPDLRQLETAVGILKDAERVFLDCLMEYERGRN